MDPANGLVAVSNHWLGPVTVNMLYLKKAKYLIKPRRSLLNQSLGEFLDSHLRTVIREGMHINVKVVV